MSDGIFEPANRSPHRESKLRHSGSNPTGSQTMSFTPEYSSEADQVAHATLNQRIKRPNPLDAEAPTQASRKLRGETGLISKEPLS
jgi:hypothetical protein